MGTKMKAAILACVLLGLSASAYAEDFEVTEDISPRFLGVGFNTSSTATSLTLLGVIGYLVYVGGLLGTSSSGYNRNDYYDPAQYDPAYAQGYAQQAQYRSDNAGGFDVMSILSAIEKVKDIYETIQQTR